MAGRQRLGWSPSGCWSRRMAAISRSATPSGAKSAPSKKIGLRLVLILPVGCGVSAPVNLYRGRAPPPCSPWSDRCPSKGLHIAETLVDLVGLCGRQGYKQCLPPSHRRPRPCLAPPGRVRLRIIRQIGDMRLPHRPCRMPKVLSMPAGRSSGGAGPGRHHHLVGPTCPMPGFPAMTGADFALVQISRPSKPLRLLASNHRRPVQCVRRGGQAVTDRA